MKIVGAHICGQPPIDKVEDRPTTLPNRCAEVQAQDQGTEHREVQALHSEDFGREETDLQ